MLTPKSNRLGYLVRIGPINHADPDAGKMLRESREIL